MRAQFIRLPRPTGDGPPAPPPFELLCDQEALHELLILQIIRCFGGIARREHVERVLGLLAGQLDLGDGASLSTSLACILDRLDQRGHLKRRQPAGVLCVSPTAPRVTAGDHLNPEVISTATAIVLREVYCS